MLNLEEIKQPSKISNITKLIILLVTYLVLRDLNTKLPYLNLLNNNWEAKLSIVFIIAILLFKPTLDDLIHSAIGLIILYGLLVILTGNSFEVFGLGIFSILILVIFKMFKSIK